MGLSGTVSAIVHPGYSRVQSTIAGGPGGTTFSDKSGLQQLLGCLRKALVGGACEDAERLCQQKVGISAKHAGVFLNIARNPVNIRK